MTEATIFELNNEQLEVIAGGPYAAGYSTYVNSGYVAGYRTN